MYLGKIVEYGPKATIFARPAHPYTRALLASTPSLDARRAARACPLPGELPSPLHPPPAVRSTRAVRMRSPAAHRGPHVLRRSGRALVACHRAPGAEWLISRRCRSTPSELIQPAACLHPAPHRAIRRRHGGRRTGRIRLFNFTAIRSCPSAAERRSATFRRPRRRLSGTAFDRCARMLARAPTQSFRRDPALVGDGTNGAAAVDFPPQPNAAHQSRIAPRCDAPRVRNSDASLTQNWSTDLHERAGSERSLIHLHGSIHAPRCFACQRPARAHAAIRRWSREGGRAIWSAPRLRPQLRRATCGRALVGSAKLCAHDSMKRARSPPRSDATRSFSIGTSSLVSIPRPQLPRTSPARRACRRDSRSILADHGSSIVLPRFNLRGAAAVVMPALVASRRKWER